MKATKDALASDEAARRALKAMEFSDEEGTAHLVRGNLRWYFFKRWARLLALVVIALWLLAGRNLSWPALGALVGVSALVLYLLGGLWAAREFKRYGWVDDGNAYRPVAKK